MKRRLLASLLALCIVLAMVPTAFAAAIEPTFPEGQYDFVEDDSAYKIVDSSANTVEVARYYKSGFNENGNTIYEMQYSGKTLTIPATVTNNNT